MEIERKFIVSELPENLQDYPHHEIEQGYLCMDPVIRIRRMDKQYFLNSLWIKRHMSTFFPKSMEF